MEDKLPPNGKFSRTIEVGWHVVSAIVLIGTVLAAVSVGYGYIAVMNVRLERVIADQREDRDNLRNFSTEIRVTLDKIASQISGLREDVAKKH